MKTKHNILILALLLAFISGYAQTDSLTNYIRQAKTNNPGIMSEKAKFLADSASAKGSGILPDPHSSVSYLKGTMPNGPQAMQVMVSQSFPWMGTLKVKKQIAGEMRKEQYEAYLDKENKIASDITAAYLQYYELEKDMEFLHGNINNMQMIEKLSLTAYQAGKVSMADVLRIQMRVLELQNKLEDIKGKKEVVKTTIHKLLNKDSGDIYIPDTLLPLPMPITENILSDSVFINNPKLLAQGYREQRMKDGITLAGKEGLPQFSVNVGYQGVLTSPEIVRADGMHIPMLMNMFMPGVGISLPIYRKKYKAMQQEATFQSQSAEYALADMKNNLQVQLADEYNNYETAQRQTVLMTEQLKLAQEALTIMITEYSSGSNNIDALLETENQLLNYQEKLVEGIVLQNTAVAKINYLMGK